MWNQVRLPNDLSKGKLVSVQEPSFIKSSYRLNIIEQKKVRPGMLRKDRSREGLNEYRLMLLLPLLIFLFVSIAETSPFKDQSGEEPATRLSSGKRQMTDEDSTARDTTSQNNSGMGMGMMHGRGMGMMMRRRRGQNKRRDPG